MLRTFELQSERDRTQSILEALGEAVIVADMEGKLQYLNPAASALTGYTREEAVGQGWRLPQNDSQPDELDQQVRDTVRSGQMWHGTVVNKRKDGTTYDAAMTVAPLFDPHDPRQPIGFASVQRDITPLKEAERLKDQFVSNVSHELRTPLSVIALISGNLETLYARLDDGKRRKMIRDIREHARVLDDLVGSVLEISRIDGQRISMERQQVDLAQLAREEADKQMPLAGKKSQTLRVIGDEGLSVWGNDGQLRQVIRNLLNNAIKYTSDGGQITCECLARAGHELVEAAWPGSAGLPAGGWVALRVVDTGIAISPQDLPHIFERFYRVQSQGNIPGTGLGLSIARELVELHGGHIAAASTPGEGSIFAIYLPLLEEE
jgi:PAS domain S-box-containing protein